MIGAVIGLVAIIKREALRFFMQRGRFVAALVRPLVWLVIFAVGFRAVLNLPIEPPYETSIPYELYIVPGLCGMIQLFNGMQSSLSLVYDREMGSMRLLLTSPQPRWWLLLSRLFAATLISILRVYAFLGIAWLMGIRFSQEGYLMLLPVLVITGLMLGALGLLLSSTIKQLEKFTGVIDFVIFPMFFLSTALYPLWQMAKASTLLRDMSAVNPFTHAVELIRFALHAQWNFWALFWVALAFLVFLAGSIWGYDPSKALTTRKAR